AVILEAVAVAKSVPFTVAQPPTNPLGTPVIRICPAGEFGVKFTVAPDPRVPADAKLSVAVPPAPGVTFTVDAPDRGINCPTCSVVLVPFAPSKLKVPPS